MSKTDDEINRLLILNSGGANPEDYLTPKQFERYKKNPKRFIDIDIDLVMNEKNKQRTNNLITMSKKDKPSFDYEAELFTLRRGLSEGTIKDHHEVVPHKQRVSNYKWKYQKGVQIVNGKPVPWDKRTNKPYDEKVAAKHVEAENQKLYDKFHLKYYKTTTPEKDLTYVEAYKDLEDYKRSRYRKVYNHIRRGFSPEIIGKNGEETGVTLYDRNLQLDLKRREEELLKLKSGTKYEREELKKLREKLKPETKQS